MSFAEIATEWWKTLEQHPGDRANLRRADDIIVAVPIRACREFLAATGGIGQDDRVVEARVAVTLVLAQIRSDSGGAHFARRLGLQAGADKPVLAEPRFRRLLQIERPLDLVLPLRRALRLLDQSAPVGDLADSIRYWGDKTKRRWLFQYYDATTPFSSADAAPASLSVA
jgi:CRISPR system Cascade subunit CasB